MNHSDLMDYEYLARTYDEANIPLYLSYPVTSWWKTPVDEQRFAGEYAGTARPFLYFHFPYCRKACFYCACYKAVSSDPLKNDVYIDHLEKEFSRTLDLLGTSGFSDVGHLHWGGGTPTYLTLPQIERIFSATARRIDFSSDTASSISIEAYPDERDITVEKLKLLRDLGFNEISFGIQDFDPRIQWVINRDTRVETVRSVVEMSKEQGFRVHVDLCYGLPFQGQNELERTIDIVLSMAPDRVALFTYAHYPLIFPLQRRIPVSSVPNSFIRVLMTRCAEERFLGEGYRKVGYDHFVREGNALHRAAEEGKVVRDFMGYSVENRRQFIGFGHSAISFIGKGFFQNKLSLDAYYDDVAAGRLPIESRIGHLLTRDDEIRNHLIQQCIMGDSAIDTKDVESRFAIDFNTYFKQELLRLEDLRKNGLVDIPDDTTLILTEKGRVFARHVARVFDAYQ